jgi:hypothetical protein
LKKYPHILNETQIVFVNKSMRVNN